MEAFRTSRAEFLQEVGKAYDLIGAKLSAELDEENTARIPGKELQRLTEDSARCVRLEEENLRLAVELERCKNLADKVAELEENNRRLQRELQAALQMKQKIFSTPARAHQLPGTPAPTPVIQELPSIQQTLNDGAKFVAGETYNLLARKHNNLYEQWKHQKHKRDDFEAVCTRQKQTLKIWQELVEKQNKKLQQKDDKIKRLKVGLERLEPAAGTTFERPRESLPLQTANPLLPISSGASERPCSDSVSAVAMNPDARSSDRPKSTNAAQSPISIASTCLGPGNGFETENPKSLERPLELEQEHEFPITTHCDPIIIHDFEKEFDAELEISLPKLPDLSRRVEMSQKRHSGSTEEDQSPKNGEQNVADPLENAPSSSPIVVSTRPVRKRKARPPVTKLTKVKLEIGSSSPASALRSGDSLDLDDIGEKVNTPKKLRRLEDMRQARLAYSQDTQSSNGDNGIRVHSQLGAASEQVPQETPVHDLETSRTGSVLQPLNVNKQILPVSSNCRERKRRRILGDSDIELVAEDGPDIFAKTRHEPSEKLVELLQRPSPAKAVLSKAVRMLNSGKPHSKHPVGSSITVHQKEVQVSESARMPLSTPKTPLNRLHLSPALSSEIFNSKSNEPPPIKSRGSSDANPSAGDTPHITTTMKPPPNFGISNSTTARSRSLNGTPARPADAKSASTTRRRQPRTKQTPLDWEHDPEQEPLRLRPVESLRLEDFKINPNYNQGYSYAFSEVVRDKDQRGTLHACTKPECCGDKFRALAMAGRNFDVSPTASQEEAHDKLLSEFLGANAWKLPTMSKAEREATWLQARTRQLANEHGKHRHAYERPASPPGFWRADFPTTQEEIADRERAEEAHRDQVRHRYEEAMREKGAFIFRDE